MDSQNYEVGERAACRACLNSDGAQLFNWNQIVDSGGHAMSYMECFKECTHLNLPPELPQMLCYDCGFELKEAYAFILKAKASDEVLRSGQYVAMEAYVELPKSEDVKLMQQADAQEIDQLECVYEKCKLDIEFMNNVEETEALVCEDSLMEQFLSETDNDSTQEYGEKYPSREEVKENCYFCGILVASVDLETHIEKLHPDVQLHTEQTEDEELEFVETHSDVVSLCSSKIKRESKEEEEETSLQAEHQLSSTITIERASTRKRRAKAPQPLEKEKSSKRSKVSQSDMELCRFCNKVYQRRYIKKHIRSVHTGIAEEEMELCEICKKSFHKNYIKRHHENVHTPIDHKSGVTCDVCNKIYTKNSIQHHIKTVHGTRDYLCHVCSRGFKSAQHLRKHVRTHDINRARNYTCEQCGRAFLTQKIYEGHLITHDKNRKAEFKCDQCDKTFFARSGWVLHMRFHTGDTHNCDICSKPFARPVDLKVHMRSHSEERPYKCKHCDMSFKNVSALNKHTLKHIGYRYKCDYCDKEYMSSSTLSDHRKKHTGMPLMCSKCKRGFPSKKLLRRHIETLHKVTDREEIEKMIVKIKKEKDFVPRTFVMLEEHDEEET